MRPVRTFSSPLSRPIINEKMVDGDLTYYRLIRRMKNNENYAFQVVATKSHERHEVALLLIEARRKLRRAIALREDQYMKWRT